MKSKFGISCIICGIILMVSALYLHCMNQEEDKQAKESAEAVMPNLVQQIQEQRAQEESRQGENDSSLELQIPVALLTEEDKKMAEIEIEGNLYIGYLSIPNLNLELPIMSTWSYEQLNVAPCRYNGSIRGEDLVLMAHNYDSHFGRLSQLNLADQIQFTDVEGVTTWYEVVGKDILDPTAVSEMTAGDFDLTLFTCTYGGENRITIYCNKIKK